MNCHCGARAVILDPPRCKEHLTRSVQEQVFKTIEEFNLIEKNAKVAVAVSGGKDSLTLLHILAQRYNVAAIAIDEGIKGYRERTLEDAKSVCARLNIPLRIFAAASVALTVDERQSEHPCSACGTVRRYLLNDAAKEFDVIATGHNADDEAQTVMMNLIRGHTALLARAGPKGKAGAFTTRIKPLYFVSERDIAAYAWVNNLTRDFSECPYAHLAYRSLMRDAIATYAKQHPGASTRLLRCVLRMQQSLPSGRLLRTCEQCNRPSSNALCALCVLKQTEKLPILEPQEE
jgi:uncharacterized protein (TIGR00269 family)